MNSVTEIKNGRLYFDGCDTVELAKEYGTPVYVMSYTEIAKRLTELQDEFNKMMDRVEAEIKKK